MHEVSEFYGKLHHRSEKITHYYKKYIYVHYIVTLETLELMVGNLQRDGLIGSVIMSGPYSSMNTAGTN